MSKGLSLLEEFRRERTVQQPQYSRVNRGTDKVQASVNPEVNRLLPLRMLLLAHVRLVLVVDEVDDGGPRVAVVDVVAEAGGVDDRQLRLELLLLELGLDDLDVRQLVELLLVAPGVVLVRGELGGEERVDERRLSEAGLAWTAACQCSDTRSTNERVPESGARGQA